ncbi:hypothetical protein IAQ61_010117 [Plenodomus lingam]|nr:hypothetical protein IAQ61_010117 [Plenodomus lingam]
MSSSKFLEALVRLPEELHMFILRELCVADVLALRHTCRALNWLIIGNAPALVRHCVRQRMGSLHLQLYPAPKPDGLPLSFLLAMRRRHIASIRLTRQLANQLVGQGVQSSCGRQRQLWTSVYERMLPLVFGVGYFLDEHRRVLLERDLGRIRPRWPIGYDICTTEAITGEERMVMKKLDGPLRLQYFYLYCFVLQVLQRMLRPSQPGGMMERRVCRQAVCAEEIAFLVLLGGIGQMAKLMAWPTYEERRGYLDAYMTHMSPHSSKCWRRHWRNIGVLSPALLDEIPCARIGITRLDQVWAPLIAQMMGPGMREFSEAERVRYEEVRRTKKYINEVVGYDILQGRTADGSSDFDGFDDLPGSGP